VCITLGVIIIIVVVAAAVAATITLALKSIMTPDFF